MQETSRQKPKPSSPSPVATAPALSDRPPFPIVGIGASAGGLEALEQFLGHVPPACGMAFVVVQHLDPNYKGMIVELLQRTTSMPVHQVEDGMVVVPEQVYVIPPNHDLSILNGVLYLLEPAAPRGLRLPIDFFLRSLAEDQQERSIGVILSGMGSDGTLGLRAIKEKAGAVFVQSPDQARFDGMPRSAVDDGQADVVAAADELPAHIMAYLEHLPMLGEATPVGSMPADRSGLDKVVLLLRTHTGHDFSLYKKNTLYRRIERRMGLHQLPRIADYVRYLRENPQEIDLLFKELLIGVTRFFRDPELWQQIKAEVIPALLASQPRGGTLRAWSAGCSSGEEAYSLAICFLEAVQELKPAPPCTLQILATDLDPDAINKARAGLYPADISADVSAERLQRFFVQKERSYRVSSEIRQMVIFAPQNLVMDPPFTKIDLLSCRNLLIYLEPELQKRLLPLFHYSLKPGGFLVLGSAETIGEAGALFSALPGRTRLYQRRDQGSSAEITCFPAAFPYSRLGHTQKMTFSTPSPLSALNLQKQTDSLLLQHFCPSAVLTNDRGDIVYISGKTGKYLEPAAGKANLNLFAMAREGLSGELTYAFAKAVRDNAVVRLPSLAVGSEGNTQFVNLTVQPLSEPSALKGMVLVVFAESTAPLSARTPQRADGSTEHQLKLSAAVEELRQCREELHITHEEMQQSQEELRSANEELQSINEELTTSKEEMQSMNEELQTVNYELQAKVDAL